MPIDVTVTNSTVSCGTSAVERRVLARGCTMGEPRGREQGRVRGAPETFAKRLRSRGTLRRSRPAHTSGTTPIRFPRRELPGLVPLSNLTSPWRNGDGGNNETERERTRARAHACSLAVTVTARVRAHVLTPPRNSFSLFQSHACVLSSYWWTQRSLTAKRCAELPSLSPSLPLSLSLCLSPSLPLSLSPSLSFPCSEKRQYCIIFYISYI